MRRSLFPAWQGVDERDNKQIRQQVGPVISCLLPDAWLTRQLKTCRGEADENVVLPLPLCSNL